MRHVNVFTTVVRVARRLPLACLWRRLPAGTQALVWLYDYNNSSCAWEKSDAYVSSLVSQLAANPKVAGFYFSNEPDPAGCSNAIADHRERNALIKSLAPSKFTLIGLDANTPNVFDAYLSAWKGSADFLNYNPYICYQGQACDYAYLDHILVEAEALGQPYFIALQAFGDSEWRWPTAAEEATMLNRIKDPALVGLGGYLTFSWNWANDPLLNHPAVLAEIRAYNLGQPSPCCP